MNRFAFGSALAVLALAMPATAFAQRTPGAQIVVVDTDRVYRECTACRAAQTQLQGQITALQQRTQQLGQPLETEIKSLQQAAQAARAQTGAARTAAESALQQRATALQGRQASASQELQGREQTLRSTQSHVVQQINVQLNPIINQVMTQRGANIALDTNATLARAAALDVTNDVLTALNQRLPSVSVTPLPQQTAPAAPQTPRPTGR